VAIIRSEKVLEDDGDVKVRVLNESPKVLKEGEKAIKFIDVFQHGVLGVNDELGIPSISINLAIITSDEKGGVTMEASARAMSVEALNYLTESTTTLFDFYGFSVDVQDKYPAWKPDISEFTNLVSEEMKAVFGRTKMMAIHAGLECGVIAEKYPAMKFASIGPTIRYPHSTREEVDLESVERTYEVLVGIINRV
jgi:dipeptidase D